MMRSVSSLIMSLSSFSGVVLCYLLIRQDIPFVSWQLIAYEPTPLLSFATRNAFCILFLMILAKFSVYLAKRYFSNTGGFSIIEIKALESIAVPTYIGLFVVSMSVAAANFDGSIVAGLKIVDAVGIIAMTLMFIFWRRIERILYFNPIWLILGFRFYEIKAADGNTYTLITWREDMKRRQRMDSLLRINNYTYMEIR